MEGTAAPQSHTAVLAGAVKRLQSKIVAVSIAKDVFALRPSAP